MFSLVGKKALVTGASGGIGEAIAEALHSQGAHVVLSGRRQDALEQIAERLGERASILVADLSEREQAATIFDQAEEQSGGIDILVCNAGITKDNLLLRMKDDEWDQVIAVNLTASFMINRAAFKRMMRRKWGRIINIASVVGVSGNPGQANYVSAKAGLIGLTKTVAQESASRGITANCIAPGFIETSMTDALNEQQKAGILSSIPLGRMGKSAEIAAAAAFLASDEAAYITGHTLHVNGGMLTL
jgi:3-oxoacyl-[acyl-carrier protein] reductase